MHVHKRSAFLPRHHPSLVSARLAEGGLRCNLDAFVEAPNPHSTKVHQWLNADAQISARADRLTQHADMIGRRLSMHHGWGDSLGSEALQRHRVKMRWRQVWLVHAQTVGEPSSAEGLRRMVLAAIAAINDKYRAGVVRARLLCNSRDPAEDDFGQTARFLDEVKVELGYIKEERSIFLAALRELDACGDSSRLSVWMESRGSVWSWLLASGYTPCAPPCLAASSVQNDTQNATESPNEAGACCLVPVGRIGCDWQCDPESALNPSEKREPKNEEDECVICRDAQKTHVLVPCGHMCVCGACASVVDSCPICRKPIERSLMVYK